MVLCSISFINCILSLFIDVIVLKNLVPKLKCFVAISASSLPLLGVAIKTLLPILLICMVFARNLLIIIPPVLWPIRLICLAFPI